MSSGPGTKPNESGHALMATEVLTPAERLQSRIAWFATVGVCLYLGWRCLQSTWRTRLFDALLQGLGQPVSGVEAFLLRHYLWIYPMLFGGAVLFLLAKEVVMTDKRLSLALTLAVAVGLLQWVNFFLYSPLRVLGALGQ